MPYRKPMIGEIETTSGFGYRTDPFIGRPAMHTGLDFRGDTGDPVRATAAGKVDSAGLERRLRPHGRDRAQRQALDPLRPSFRRSTSKVGDYVQDRPGGRRVGSTGRSTGPHLHYETRIDGDAVDPQKFLRAGIRLGGAA